MWSKPSLRRSSTVRQEWMPKPIEESAAARRWEAAQFRAASISTISRAFLAILGMLVTFREWGCLPQAGARRTRRRYRETGAACTPSRGQRAPAGTSGSERVTGGRQSRSLSLVGEGQGRGLRGRLAADDGQPAVDGELLGSEGRPEAPGGRVGETSDFAAHPGR